MSKEVKGVEIFAEGVWHEIPFQQKELSLIVAAFEKLKDVFKIPLKLGHNEDQPLTDGLPALGRIDKVYIQGKKLLADFVDVPDIVYEAIKSKLYTTVSVELELGVTYKKQDFPVVLSGVALLGADLPAVNTLNDLSAFLTRSGKIKRKSKVTFSYKQTKEAITMPKTVAELEAELDAESQKTKLYSKENKKLQEDSLKVTAENTKLKHDSEEKEKLEKETAFKKAKSDLTTEFDLLVKAEIITPAQREGFTASITDSASVEGVRTTLETLKMGHEETIKNFSTKKEEQSKSKDKDKDKEEGKTPDVIILSRVRTAQLKSPELSFDCAREMVMQADTELANDYIHMYDKKEA